MPEPVGVPARSAGLALVLLTIFAFLPILVWGGWVWDDRADMAGQRGQAGELFFCCPAAR